MNPLRRVDRWMRAHPVLTDLAVTGLLLVLFGGVPWSLAAPMDDPGRLQTTVAVLISLGLIAPWAIRRVRPVLSAALVTVFALLHLFFGPEFSSALCLVPMTVYNLAARGPRWASLAGLGTALLGGLLNGVKMWLFPTWALGSGEARPYEYGPEALLFMGLGCGLVSLTMWAFGDVARNRRLTLQALEDRARRLEEQARQERRLAAADERSHIAREMHDIVAHSLQVIISQSDGARYAAAARPETAVQALATIGETGRTALADMRQLLGVLRTGDAEAPEGSPRAVAYRPQPRLSDLPDLLETMRLSGLEIAVTETGEPRRALPAGGELTAYRIVQEALTNTLRHGGPRARADVALTWTPRGLDIQADDDGRGADADPATAGSGQGLRGLAERVALFGGTVETGPRPEGGFRVRAHLPYSAV